MTVFSTAILAIVILCLAFTAIAAVIRIVRGPTILDRMIASDVLLTTLILAVGADMVVRNHTENLTLMTSVAATAVLATIVVALYVRRRARNDDQDVRKGTSHV